MLDLPPPDETLPRARLRGTPVRQPSFSFDHLSDFRPESYSNKGRWRDLARGELLQTLGGMLMACAFFGTCAAVVLGALAVAHTVSERIHLPVLVSASR